MQPQFYITVSNLLSYLGLDFVFKLHTLGFLIFAGFLYRTKFQISFIELILTVSLIYHLSTLLELILCKLIFICKFNLLEFLNINNLDLTSNMSSGTGNPNSEDGIPRGNGNNREDTGRIIRYIATNVAALAIRRPMTRAAGIAIANAGNIIADILSDPERANYWIDNIQHFQRYGRFRGGQEGYGPFERGTSPFDPALLEGNKGPDSDTGPGSSSGGNSGSGSITSSFTSDSNNNFNFLDNLDISFIKNFFSPVEHTMSLDTLLNLHFMLIFLLFILIACLIILTLYYYLNLIILFNKDFFLNKVKNKYVLMYVKFIIFRTRIDIAAIGAIILGVLIFTAYILHYLIVHPIIL